MGTTGWSRRGFLLLPGAAAIASAAIYGVRQVTRSTSGPRPHHAAGVEPYVDQDGWMLDPADRLRTARPPGGTAP